VGPCAKTCAIAKKGSTTLNTKAARDNPDLLFVLMSFSMVWLGLVLGIINIFRADKFFFHFFEKIFERPGGPFVYVWFVLGGFVAGFVLDYAFSFVRAWRDSLPAPG
jgi:hypothetical protein